MCGIAGLWDGSGAGSDAVALALEAIRHRGPDGQGMLVDRPVVLGNRRLAIIDVAGGDQPIGNESGDVQVVYNGEIFNHRELAAGLAARGHRLRSHCDTEVLVHLWEEKGPRMCDELRGMWALALWDRRQRQLFLARDRYGKKPLYFARTPAGGLAFASELKALRPLLESAGVSPQIDPQALYDYLSLGVVPQPRTIYRGVESLDAASYLLFDGTRLERGTYWRLPLSAPRQRPYEELLEEVRAAISESVRIRLESEVPLGIFLSGGLDSSIVAYEAVRALGRGGHAFTVAVADEALDESAQAAATARQLGLEHTVLPLSVSPREELERLVRHYDQPFADASAIPSLAISRLARSVVTVVLNGDGGDELFAGYRRYQAALWADRFGIAARRPWPLARSLPGPFAQRRRSAVGFARRFLRGLAEPLGARYLVWTTDLLLDRDKRGLFRGDRQRPTEEWVEERLGAARTHLGSLLRGDLRINLQSDLLVKMDIATMAASVEARSPLLDYRLAELLATVAHPLKLNHGRTKALLRDAYRGRLPAAVVDAPKRGFEVPLESWLAGELAPLLADTVGSRQARLRDWLEPRAVDDLLARRRFAERNWAALVYALLVLELWLREFA